MKLECKFGSLNQGVMTTEVVSGASAPRPRSQEKSLVSAFQSHRSDLRNGNTLMGKRFVGRSNRSGNPNTGKMRQNLVITIKTTMKNKTK